MVNRWITGIEDMTEIMEGVIVLQDIIIIINQIKMREWNIIIIILQQSLNQIIIHLSNLIKVILNQAIIRKIKTIFLISKLLIIKAAIYHLIVINKCHNLQVLLTKVLLTKVLIIKIKSSLQGIQLW